MIRSITQKKPEEEIERLLKGFNRIFIIGCGTCVTLTHTGGEPEVRELKDRPFRKRQAGYRDHGGSGSL